MFEFVVEEFEVLLVVEDIGFVVLEVLVVDIVDVLSLE